MTTDPASKIEKAAPTHDGRGLPLSRLVLRLFACRHKDWTGLMNYWDTTATNGFYMPIEQRCAKCGAYQHRRLSARKLGKIKCEWHRGKHPKSPENDQEEARRK
jgi:hypothetical protein